MDSRNVVAGRWKQSKVMAEKTIDHVSGDAPQHCPLCGRLNHCAMAGATTVAVNSCWCHKVTIPEGLLRQLPKAMRCKACICQRCVDEYNRHECLNING